MAVHVNPSFRHVQRYAELTFTGYEALCDGVALTRNNLDWKPAYPADTCEVIAAEPTP
jgi:hypothetical protein